jgi:beta-glucosidase
MRPTGGTNVDDQQTQRVAQAPMTDDEIQSRIDELIAELTPAEKAGQLTQYFYFGSVPETDAEQISHRRPSEQAAMVEAALRRGEAGSLLFVTDAAEINRLQQLTIEGNRLGIPALFGFDVIHGLRTIFPVPIAMAASWIPRRSSRASPSPHVKRGQSGFTGHLRRW